MTTTASGLRVGIAVAGAALALLAVPTPAQAEPPSLFALVDAAAQRLETADAVAASKWITHAPIEDAVREQQVIDAVTAAAGDVGVDPSYVARAFRDQIDATVAVQYDRFGEWKLDPGGAPTAAPDLSDSRATIDALNRTMVSEIAAQWDSLRAPQCDVDLETASNDVAAARDLDAEYRRALAFATRSYCQ
ncbi:secreted chorismate mutase [Mycobacterium antarcticum]|uniref:chorismate mutase n=1 Tax=unclassified Mycolicibacterium TaxID=2636767 RepID=UPI002397761A|nr:MULTISPECIES: chorismate mutase [unclassified Mycolicibacterium]BDX35008.1 secreted chorismate mutase [Mycolicibacterium sp. TUM20985]GLP78235.1 secreted chorismate mutase [Mycolicibacterium sp. TUM20983]